MTKFFKKLAVGVGIGLTAITCYAANSTVTLDTSNTYTNVPTALGGSFTLLSATVTAPANNTATIKIYDAPGTNISLSIGGFSSVLSYVTNYTNGIFWFTNYYGVKTALTNLVLVDVSNWTAAATAIYPSMYTWTIPTNSTVVFSSLNQRFQNGAYITNYGNTTVTINLQYTQ